MGFHHRRRPHQSADHRAMTSRSARQPEDRATTIVSGPATHDLEGKRALVSGGTRGVGAAIATRLKTGGATVTAVGLPEHPPDRVAADAFILADISTTEGTDAVIAPLIDGGGVDIIVHVAGGAASAPSGGFARLTPELWQQT